MTVNEIIYALIGEALFGQRAEGNAGNSIKSLANEKDPEIWNKVYAELQAQAVVGITAPVAARHGEIPENLRRKWTSLQKPFAIKYVQMAAGQSETCQLFQEAGIRVAVMKGMAAAIYYPVPEYRVMGDVDLLVSPEDYERAANLLKNNGYMLEGGEDEPYHTALSKYGILYELHKSPAGTHISDKGKAVAEYILSGLDHIEVNTLGQDQFPVLPWQQNGMELIWHIRQHLYNGLGLRQIVDWMMFVSNMLDDDKMLEYKSALQVCGLYQLAIVVTKMCQKYLGLRTENITWCSRADEGLCDDLMDFIMGQGNFGIKAMDEKTAKVLSGYNNPKIMLRKLQEVGKLKWTVLKKYPMLTHVAFVYGGIFSVRTLLEQKGGWKKILKDFRLGRRRTRMFSRLYGEKAEKKARSGRSSGKATAENCGFLKPVRIFGKNSVSNLKEVIESRKNKVRHFLGFINSTRLSIVFKTVANIVAKAEYYIYDFICFIKGYQMPSITEKKYVRENVTFIYKSFERQKMATELYKSIQRFYPGTRVVIADDSRKPLKISGKYVDVINLPFNSGLSYGLNQALNSVKTTYVIRLDDDHLLTRRTHVGDQIEFLHKHPEIDLVGFGLLNALRLETPEEHICKFYPQSMNYAPKSLKIPHLTRIDKTHIVLGKGLNLFLIKTETLKRIGYDDKIRMMDHDDFFYRAAGNIVSVVAEDTRVFHRHNPFDSHYLQYRGDVEEDVGYIWRTRQKR